VGFVFLHVANYSTELYRVLAASFDISIETNCLGKGKLTAGRRKLTRVCYCAEEHGVEGLSIVGLHCDLHEDPELAQAIDREDFLQPWPGAPEVLLDRFDARLLLDSPAVLARPSRY
jgi:Alternative splicing regulator